MLTIAYLNQENTPKPKVKHLTKRQKQHARCVASLALQRIADKKQAIKILEKFKKGRELPPTSPKV
jgi:hypothetical protein